MKIKKNELELTIEELETINYKLPEDMRIWLMKNMERITGVKFFVRKDEKSK